MEVLCGVYMFLSSNYILSRVSEINFINIIFLIISYYCISKKKFINIFLINNT